MLIKTFYGGVHPPGYKNTSSKPIRPARIPKRVVIPLSQHTGAPCEPAVAVGDIVKKGTLIGKAAAFISSPVHSSISGRVAKIAQMPHPVLGRSLAAVIENDGTIKEEDAPPGAFKDEDIKALPKEALLETIKNSGIVGLGGAAFPTHVKLSPPKGKKIDSVILNGAECEPYLTCDERLMIEKSEEMIKGLRVISRILGADKAYIAIEDNKPNAIAAMKDAVRRTPYTVRVISLPTKYPQGAEKSLIKSALNRIVPAGGLPMDVGCVVQNAGTAYAVYEAVYLGRPLIERPITISGDCVSEPVNLSVRIGTLASDLLSDIGPFIASPGRVIFGGPMMGIAQYRWMSP